MARQQRTQNNRGSLQTPNLRPVADMAWTITGGGAGDIEITVDTDPTRLFLQRTPQFHGESPDQMATSATLAGTLLVITFPAPPTPGTAIEILSTDPGLRSNLGAYLAAGRLLIPPDPPPPCPIYARSPWTAGTIVGTDCIVSFSGSPGIGGSSGTLQFRNATKGEDATVTIVVGNDITVTLPTAPDAGDLLTFPDGIASLWLDNGTLPDLGPVTLGP